MNTTGWAILAVGVMFSSDLQKLMIGKEAPNSIVGVCAAIVIISIIIMFICTFKQNG